MGESGCRTVEEMISVQFFLRRVRRRKFFFFYFSFEMGGGEDVGVVFDGDEDGFLFGGEGCRLVCGFFLLLIVDGILAPPFPSPLP